MSGPIRLVIYGAPRTKKNSNRLVTAGGRQRVLPSAAWKGWAASARLEYQAKLFPLRGVAYPVNCCALFYRDAERGDAVGYYQGLADLLESRGILANDKHIVSWDGSRLLKDAARPRVELILTPV
jgi:hypothetical protein